MIERITLPGSVPGVADVELLGGEDPGRPVDLVVEVPHGADRFAHYQATRALLGGVFPRDLHEFFFVNTDVGAWQIGRRVAEEVAAADPRRRVLVVRSLIPRTFIDCNRVEDADAAEGSLGAGGMTAGIAAYVHDPVDRATLLGLYRQYTAVVAAAHAALAGDGFLLMPHTYGPTSLGIESIGDDIVTQLRWAHEPERYATWPRRPAVDLITRTADRVVHAAADVANAVAAALATDGLEVGDNATYHLHPSTLGCRWAQRFSGRNLCLEVRRDLVCQKWSWNQENEVEPRSIDRFAGPLAAAIDAWLRKRNAAG